MTISAIHTYLVYPTKRGDKPESIPGTAVELSGKMFDLLRGIYDRSEMECNIAISFNHQHDGKQKNACRDLILGYIENPSAENGEYLAARLAAFTTNRSGMGLLFLIKGIEGLHHKLVISRFPADSGISAEQDANGLSVAFLEKIFMKSAKSYKSALFKHESIKTGFWRGQVVDRQLNEGDVSDYWIIEFLESDLFTTGAAGTQRLAKAFKMAAKAATDIEVKSELAAAMKLAPGQHGKRQSTDQILSNLGLSADARAAVAEHIKPAALREQFKFDAQEFSAHVKFQTVELSNGALLSAQSEDFDKVFQTKKLEKNMVRISTEGEIKDIRVGKGRR